MSSIRWVASASQVLAAAVGIIAVGVLLHVLTYDVRKRVTSAYALLLVSLIAVYGGRALSSASPSPSEQMGWLRVQWLGAIWLPAAYLHFSDAVLATTGRPSRGRRRWAVRLTYALAFVGSGVALARPTWLWAGFAREPAPHFRIAWGAWAFAVYYAVIMLWAVVNLLRARSRTRVAASRRRMTYLAWAAWLIALGSFPYLSFVSFLSTPRAWFFWLLAALNDFVVAILVVTMAYAVAFFDAPQPDRWVQTRLLRWLAQGPGVVAFTLAATTFIRRLSARMWGVEYTWLVPLTMILAFLLGLHAVQTLIPWWERWVFRWQEGPEWQPLWEWERSLMTDRDVHQLLEALLTSACDRLQIPAAWVVLLEAGEPRWWIVVGEGLQLPPMDALQAVQAHGPQGGRPSLVWGGWWLYPLMDAQGRLLGILGLYEPQALDNDARLTLQMLLRRVTWALREWHRARQLLQALYASRERPDVARLRAASRYDQAKALAPWDELPPPPELAQWVRDALRHYWGGPKLSENPLLKWRIVQQAMEQGHEHPTNALRAVLKQAIERLRPAGERRFTSEWLLYNILDLKFLQGHKGREVARRLALSEADLYRKQKQALAEVAKILAEMERAARAAEVRGNGERPRAKAAPSSAASTRDQRP
ncbi:MAG: hypothetical protein GXO54_02600 [Chloroflexi bacterium]|nr:hypothetical protein [Chloroflexota bacterium]